MPGERLDVADPHPRPVAGTTSVHARTSRVRDRGDHHLEVLGAVRVGEHEEPVPVLVVDVVLDGVLEVRCARLDDRGGASAGVAVGTKRTSLVVFESDAMIT